MPLVLKSSYEPPKLLVNPHLQTIFPALFRVVSGVNFRRERIITPDDDFLDIDWSLVGTRKLAILSHGLEGNSRQHYMLGMARAFNRQGYNVLSWNNRGCSGEINRKEYSYHCGSSDDLHTVIEHALSTKCFDEIVLVGFSMGGNITLKYVGERGDCIHPSIQRAVALSVPVDLSAAARHVTSQRNRVYFMVFMRTIKQKLWQKEALFPGRIRPERFSNVGSFKEFDDMYTAPLYGFKDAEDYWARSSSKLYLRNVAIPTLLINAQDDPLLDPGCFPAEIAQQSPNFYLETPKFGGHVGFVSFNRHGEFWSESRALEFVKDIAA